MKSMTKLLSLLLALLTLFGLAACAGTSGGETTTDPVTGDGTTTGDVTTEAVTTHYLESLPDKNYFGATYSMLLSEQMKSLTFTDVDSSNQVDSKIFNAYLKVSEQYHVKFDMVKTMSTQSAGGSAFANEVRTTTAGDAAYDLVHGQMYFMLSLADDGVLANLYGAETLSLDQPWYYQGINDQLTIYGQMYGVTGGLTMDKISLSYLLYYNKDMLKALTTSDTYAAYQDIYQIVRDGDWTYDVWNTLCQAAFLPNNDGVYDENDTYGLVSSQSHFAAIIGSNVPGFKKGDDGSWELDFYNEHLVDVFDTYKEFYHKDYVTAGIGGYEKIPIFTSGNGLFLGCHLQKMADIKDASEFEVGVLPFPKFNEEQQDYITFVNRSEAFYVPTTANFEKSTLVLDYLNYLFYEEVIPNYWEVQMKSRYNEDANDQEMLEYIRAGAWDDFGYTYRHALGAPHDGMVQQIYKDELLAAWWATKEIQIQTNFAALMEKYAKKAEK